LFHVATKAPHFEEETKHLCFWIEKSGRNTREENVCG